MSELLTRIAATDDGGAEARAGARSALGRVFGREPVSTATIAREAGVSQSQIHYHFDTKRKLWQAVFERNFAEYFAAELAELRAPGGAVEHGFLEIEPGRLTIVGDGTLFVRNVCMVFDRYLRGEEPGGPRFSRTV